MEVKVITFGFELFLAALMLALALHGHWPFAMALAVTLAGGIMVGFHARLQDE